eukprot:SAG25_NODE_2042_length_2004_cov_1.518110_1_plen_290_part_00
MNWRSATSSVRLASFSAWRDSHAEYSAALMRPSPFTSAVACISSPFDICGSRSRPAGRPVTTRAKYRCTYHAWRCHRTFKPKIFARSSRVVQLRCVFAAGEEWAPLPPGCCWPLPPQIPRCSGGGARRQTLAAGTRHRRSALATVGATVPPLVCLPRRPPAAAMLRQLLLIALLNVAQPAAARPKARAVAGHIEPGAAGVRSNHRVATAWTVKPAPARARVGIHSQRRRRRSLRGHLGTRPRGGSQAGGRSEPPRAEHSRLANWQRSERENRGSSRAIVNKNKGDRKAN